MIQYLVLHHSASKDTGRDQTSAVNQYHKEKWNFISSLGYYGGYNYFMSGKGKITQFRKDGEETAAQLGNNHNSISICCQGDFNVDLPSEAQKRSLRSFLEEKQAEYPNAKLVLHRDIQENRTCPGKLFTHELLTELLAVDIEDELKDQEIKRLMGVIAQKDRIISYLIDLIKKYYGKV